jgi:hypothetical protein
VWIKYGRRGSSMCRGHKNIHTLLASVIVTAQRALVSMQIKVSVIGSRIKYMYIGVPYHNVCRINYVNNREIETGKNETNILTMLNLKYSNNYSNYQKPYVKISPPPPL